MQSVISPGDGGSAVKVQAPMWQRIFFLILAVWLALMILPHDAVMWGLATLAVSVILFRWSEITKL